MHFLNIVWNPSKGIDLGFFTLHFYSLMWIFAFLLGFQIMKRIYKNEGQTEQALDSLFIYSVVGIMIGARMGHVIFYQPELFKQDFFSIFLPFRFNPTFEFTGFQGLASHGAAIAMIVSMYLYNKKVLHKSVLWILDRVVIPVALGAIFVRIGNFINSEIIGKETDSIFGMRFVQDYYNEYEAIQLTGIQNPKAAYQAIGHNPQFSELLANVPLVHPAQLYEAISYVFVFLLLSYFYWKTNKGDQPGFLFGLFLVLLWSVRFFVEYVKQSQGGFEESLGLLSTGQWLSIPFIIIGIYYMFFYQAKNKQVSV